MAQLPRDPRQLARDILSGKVKLEDLAREKARQQQMPGGMAPTARVPSPRPIQASPPIRQVQTAPPRPMQMPNRQATPPPPPPRQQTQRPPQQRARQMPPPVPSRQPVRQKTESMAVRTAAADVKQAQAVEAAKTAAVRAAPMNSGRAVVRQMLRNRQSVRTGILMAEILGPCKALQEGM